MKTQFLSLLVMFVGSVVGGFVCTAVMGANSLAKADDKPKAAEEKPGDRVIEAREIRIVDDKGKVRAFFGWDESVNRSALVLNDRDSNIRAAIRVADDGPEFVLSGDKKARVWLTTRLGTPQLRLDDESGFNYCNLLVQQDEPRVVLGRGTGEKMGERQGYALLSVPAEGAQMTLRGNGSPTAKSQVTSTLVAGINKDGTASIGIFDSDGDLIWQPKK